MDGDFRRAALCPTSINAVDATIRGLGGIPFAEFTRSLIGNLFEAVVDGSIAQTEAYLALLAYAAAGLSSCLNETANNIAGGDTLASFRDLPEIRDRAYGGIAGRGR